MDHEGKSSDKNKKKLEKELENYEAIMRENARENHLATKGEI